MSKKQDEIYQHSVHTLKPWLYKILHHQEEDGCFPFAGGSVPHIFGIQYDALTGSFFKPVEIHRQKIGNHNNDNNDNDKNVNNDNDNNANNNNSTTSNNSNNDNESPQKNKETTTLQANKCSHSASPSITISMRPRVESLFGGQLSISHTKIPLNLRREPIDLYATILMNSLMDLIFEKYKHVDRTPVVTHVSTRVGTVKREEQVVVKSWESSEDILKTLQSRSLANWREKSLEYVKLERSRRHCADLTPEQIKERFEELVRDGCVLLEYLFETQAVAKKTVAIKKNEIQTNQTTLLKNKFLTLQNEWNPEEDEELVELQENTFFGLDVHDKKWCRKLDDCKNPDAHSVKLIKKVGSGANSQVWKAINENGEYALKSFRLTNEQDTSAFISEVVLMSKMDHANILKIFGATLQPPYNAILTPLYSGDLDCALFSQKITFDDSAKKKITSQIAKGMEYLHHKIRYLHRDLKCANVLVNFETLATVISDFSLSTEDRQGFVSMGRLGTPVYMAPEAWKAQSRYTRAIDVFSFAITIFELYSEKRAYAEEIQTSGWQKVVEQVADQTVQKRPVFPTDFDKNMQSLLAQCWQHDFAQRPTFIQINKDLQAFF